MSPSVHLFLFPRHGYSMGVGLAPLAGTWSWLSRGCLWSSKTSVCLLCYHFSRASSEQFGHIFSFPWRNVAGTGQAAQPCTSSTATLARALAMSRELLSDHNSTRGKNKLIIKIKKKSRHFSFSKVPIFLTIPPNYRLVGFLLFPRCCCCSVDSTSLSKCLPSPSSQLAQYITITQLCRCNQIIKLHIKHALELTKEGASDMGME